MLQYDFTRLNLIRWVILRFIFFSLSFFDVVANTTKRTYFFLTCSRSGCKHASKSAEAVCVLVL
nr:MAG TPA: hypothetical protein [Caudoviricetes sp.]